MNCTSNIDVKHVVPDQDVVVRWAQEQGKTADQVDPEELKKAIAANMEELALSYKLFRFEHVQRLRLHATIFRPEEDLVAPTFKPRRNNLVYFFTKEIKEIMAIRPHRLSLALSVVKQWWVAARAPELWLQHFRERRRLQHEVAEMCACWVLLLVCVDRDSASAVSISLARIAGRSHDLAHLLLQCHQSTIKQKERANMDVSSVLLQVDVSCDGSDSSSATPLSPTASAPLSPAAQTAPEVVTARVVALTLNDVYELFPNASGQGGIAEFATLLREAKARIPSDTHVVVTLNGDFLWRSELDREDKGALMIDVLNALEVEFVVLGNHEFDFGAPLLSQLLTNANFTSFGSNIRQSGSNGTTAGELFPGLVDYQVLPLANGLKLGLFGVSTTVTGQDPFAGDEVVFEDQVPHAKRCVAQLQAQGADAIIALTHFKVAEDEALASQVPGINLILGGHDHEIMTLFKGETMIHKSGQDALWLGIVEMDIAKIEETYDKSATVSVEFQWQILCNRGFEPDPVCRALITEYSDRVHRELKAQGKLDMLAVSRTMLDGSRASCRTQETNLGNLIADALREELHADVAVINAGFIKGDRLHDADLEINAHWLEKFLPLRKPSILVEMTVGDLKSVLTQMLRKFPSMSSSFPQISGCSLVYDAASRQITTFSIGKELLSPQDNDRMLRVATALVPSIDGWEFFERGIRVNSTPGEPRLVRNLLGAFVKRQGGEIAYPHSESRLVILR